MTYLFNQKVLIIDCQTTGMHPHSSSLIQIAWSVFDFGNNDFKVDKFTLDLPEDIQLSEKVKNILKITQSDHDQSLNQKIVFDHLQNVLKSLELLHH